MEKERNNSGLIVLVVVLFLLVLGLGGYIVYDKVLSNNSNQINNHNTNTNSNANNEIDGTILNNLYSIIGILPVDQYYKNNCLNQSISQNNYRENAKSIFSWYASLMSLNTYHEDAKINVSDGVTVSVYNAAATRSISKNDASKIIFLYNFNNMNDFLTEMPKPYDNEYYYVSHANQPDVCNYDVEHNTNSQYVNSSIIRITDIQTVTEYEFGTDHTTENIKVTKNQTVTYDFTKENGGNYYLNQVTVE